MDIEIAKDQHNHGIDVLKIVVMFMIVMWHIVGHGGVIKNTQMFTVNYDVVWIIESILYCVVDVYVMITGYLYAQHDWKSQSIIKLWITVAFYSVSVPLVLRILGYNIGVKTILKGFFPILQSQYWYFTEYFALFFTIPVLNVAMSEKRRAKKIIVVGTTLLSVVPVLAQGRDLFCTNQGYSLLWFMLLYCWGAYIRLYGVYKSRNSHTLTIFYFINLTLLIFSKLGCDYIEMKLWGGIRYSGNLHSYTSPLVLIAAVLMLVLFSNIKIRNLVLSKMIRNLAALTFGVYLIHENGSFRANIISDKFVYLVNSSSIMMILQLLGWTVCIFMGCMVIEFIRNKLFSILRIDLMISRLLLAIKKRVFH